MATLQKKELWSSNYFNMNFYLVHKKPLRLLRKNKTQRLRRLYSKAAPTTRWLATTQFTPFVIENSSNAIAVNIQF